MVWRRLAAHFPNLRLQLLPLTEQQHQQVVATGWLREAAFRTEPRATKLEIRAFLEQVHGMQVERVSTINYQGKKKRRIDYQGRQHFVRLSDWKKAYVIFKPPESAALAVQQWREERAARLAEAEREAAASRALLRGLPPLQRGPPGSRRRREAEPNGLLPLPAAEQQAAQQARKQLLEEASERQRRQQRQQRQQSGRRRR